MTDKPKPAHPPKAPTGWRGKPRWGDMREPVVIARPNLLMRIGSWFFEKRTGK